MAQPITSDPTLEAYRAELAALGGGTGAALAASLPSVLSSSSPQRAFDLWVEGAAQLVLTAAREASRTSEGAYAALRLADGGFTGAAPRWVSRLPVREQVKRSLYAVSWTRFNAPTRTAPPQGPPSPFVESDGLADKKRAIEAAQVGARGAATRLVIDAGRDSVASTAITDPQAIGCIYVTRNDSRVCYWCAMLASRGPVFKGNSWAESNIQFEDNANPRERGTAKTHDFCRCIVVPVSAPGGMDLKERSAELFEAWKQVNYFPPGHPRAGQIMNSGKGAMRAWRKYWTARQRST